ncbi:Cystine-binding periplasmic protein precursor [Clostridiales bacterium CHKCI001]|nr:Cystine-binding periplasmic protein precursor [Clostridiales bacterium CHKCI001]
MRKKLWKTAAVIMAASAMLLTACGGAGENASSQNAESQGDTSSDTATNGESGEDLSLQKVKDAGKFVLGLDATFKPMGYTDENNEIVGFDIDLAEAVCEKLGVELVKEPINWDTKEQDLSVGKIDCIWNGLSVSPSREETFNLSEPYMKNAMVFVVPESSDINSTSDLAGKKVIVQNGSTAQDILTESELAANMEITSIATNIEALQQMDINLVDAVFMDEVVAQYEIKNSDKAYRILDEGLAEEEYAIAFRKEDQALRDEVQKILSELKADGTVEEISTKWFGSDITTIE